MSRPDLGVTAVLPAYEEADRLEAIVAELARVLSREASRFEILIVTSGAARDGTPALARALSARDPRVRAIEQRADDPGYGRAVAIGIAHASEPWLFLTDADGQFELEDLPKLFALARARGADAVLGYRERRADATTRKLAGRLYTAVVSLVLGVAVRDVDCAFKLIRRELVEGARFTRTTGAINAELLACVLSRTRAVEQVPVRHRAREGGGSRFEARLGSWVMPHPSEAIALARDVGSLALRAAVARLRPSRQP